MQNILAELLMEAESLHTNWCHNVRLLHETVTWQGNCSPENENQMARMATQSR